MVRYLRGLFTILGTVALLTLSSGCLRSTETPLPIEKNTQTTEKSENAQAAQLELLSTKIEQLEKRIEFYKSQTNLLQQRLTQSQNTEAQLQNRVRSLEVEIAQLQENIAALSASKFEPGSTEIDQLRKELALSLDQLVETRKVLDEVKNENHELKAKLAEEQTAHDVTKLDQLAAVKEASSQSAKNETLNSQLHSSKVELDQLNKDLSAVKTKLQEMRVSTQVQSEAMASNFDEQKSVLAEKIEQLESEVAVQSAQLDPDFSVRSQEKKPELVKVFYGTNRKRLEQTVSNILSPLLFPGLLIVLWLLIPSTIRSFVKERLQDGAIKLIRVAIFIGIAFLGITAIQKVTLQWHAYQKHAVQYGNGRIAEIDGLRYELGTVDVSIPPIHQRGEVEKPELIHLEFYPDSTKHFVLDEIKPQQSPAFYRLLNERIEKSEQRDLFVFVHGFHNTFQDAAFRTAQIAFDSQFAGAPVFFSWPSQGAVFDYPTDENNADAAIADLKQFLNDLKRNAVAAKKIHLIAHSMGNRALTAAIKEIGLESDRKPVFDELVLAAPDMDSKKLRDIAPALIAVAGRVTLYASSRDAALTISRKIHGGEHPRAGESLPTPVTFDNMDSIDVSMISGSHSYIADNGQVLSDLSAILNTGRELNKSIAILLEDRNKGKYWVLR